MTGDEMSGDEMTGDEKTWDELTGDEMTGHHKLQSSKSWFMNFENTSLFVFFIILKDLLVLLENSQQHFIMTTLLVYVLVFIGSIEASDPIECSNGINTCMQSFTNDMKTINGSNTVCSDIDSYFKCIFSHGCSLEGDMKQQILSSVKTKFDTLNCNFTIEDELNHFAAEDQLKSTAFTTLGSPAFFDTTQHQGETKMDPTECLNGVSTCMQSFTSHVETIDPSNTVCSDVDNYFKCIFSHGCSLEGNMKQQLLSYLKTTFDTLNCNLTIEDELNPLIRIIIYSYFLSSNLISDVDNYFKCIFSHGCSLEGNMKQQLLSYLKTTFDTLNCNLTIEDELNHFEADELKSTTFTTLGIPAYFDTTQHQGETKNYGNSASNMSSRYSPLIVAFSVFLVFFKKLTGTVY
nr:hypothetical protein BgiMline_024244 [Biomphalaria glabrata]